MASHGHRVSNHSRFVDDMTLSGSRRLSKFRRLAGRIIEEEGFKVKQGPKGEISCSMRAKMLWVWASISS